MFDRGPWALLLRSWRTAQAAAIGGWNAVAEQRAAGVAAVAAAAAAVVAVGGGGGDWFFWAQLGLKNHGTTRSVNAAGVRHTPPPTSIYRTSQPVLKCCPR